MTTRRNLRWAMLLSLLVTPLAALTSGCAVLGFGSVREGAYIQKPMPVPTLASPPVASAIPEPPPLPDEKVPVVEVSNEPLVLQDVLASTSEHFPLLYAIEQERQVSAAQRLSAEGQFDTSFRLRALDQEGTFDSARFDMGLEQPLPFSGVSVFGGWRLGNGDFPIYRGSAKTGDGGEFRAGLNVPLLQNRQIDPRRAKLRAAQIQEQIAEPTIRRARLDYLRGAAQAYWLWVGTGSQYDVARQLVQLARNRQSLIEEQRRADLVPETMEALNLRLLASREEQQLAAERALQQAAIRLSLFLRRSDGDPVVPTSVRLPDRFIDSSPSRPNTSRLDDDIAKALAERPEMARFQLQKEKASVDLQLARNQLYPAVNLFAGGTQDVGGAKKTYTGQGPFETDRTAVEVGVSVEVPLQRRDARGRANATEAQLTQLLAQERYARDEIAAQVQDAVSELDQTYKRLGKARTELREAVRVRSMETESFQVGRTSLVDLNLQEMAAAEAQAKVIAMLTMLFRAEAEYLVALGAEPAPITPAD